MRPRSVCVLGGTGFVGSHLVSRLIRDGYRVRVPTRSCERHKALRVLPGLELLEADVHDPVALAATLRGCDAVINLVGILNERGRNGDGFERAHARLGAQLVAACHAAGVGRLLQMSSLRAAVDAPSHYLRSKARAEQALRTQGGDLAWTIFQPSVIFGPGDGFMNKFAALLRLFPVIPLAGAGARFAPVYIGDVVEAFSRALADPSTRGQTYPLCGPDTLTLAALVRYVAAVLGLRRRVVGLPYAAGWLQAALLDFVPGKPLSLDNFRSLQLDSISADDGLGRLGIVATPLGAIVPGYLGRGLEARLDALRQASGARIGAA